MNPSGKLTITYPKSAGQLPLYYKHKPSAQHIDYLSQDVKPFYSFGYGLSNTKFSCGRPVRLDDFKTLDLQTCLFLFL